MKQIKKLCSIAMSMAFALVGLTAQAVTTDVGSVDALKSAISAAAEGDVIRLMSDLDVAYGYPLATITKSVTIDLNGKKITAAGGSYSYGAGIFRVDSETATMTMGDSVGGGAIDTDYSMLVYVNKGNLVVSGGAYSAAGTVILSYSADSDVTLNGGTFVGKDTGASYRQVIKIGGGVLTIEDGVVIEQRGTGNYSHCIVLDSGDSAVSKQTEASRLVMNGGTLNGAPAFWNHNYAISCSGFNESQINYRNGKRRAEEVVINGGTVNSFDGYGNLVNISGAARVTINDVKFTMKLSDPEAKQKGNFYERTSLCVFSGIPSASDKVCHGLTKITVNGGTFVFDVAVTARDGYTGGYGALFTPYSSEGQDTIVVNGGEFTGLNKMLNFDEKKGMLWWVPEDAKMAYDEAGNCSVVTPTAVIDVPKKEEVAKDVDVGGTGVTEEQKKEAAGQVAEQVVSAMEKANEEMTLEVAESGIKDAGKTADGKVESTLVQALKAAADGESKEQITEESEVKRSLEVKFKSAEAVVDGAVKTTTIVYDVTPYAETKIPGKTEPVKAEIPAEAFNEKVNFRMTLTQDFKDKWIKVSRRPTGSVDAWEDVGLFRASNEDGVNFVQVAVDHFCEMKNTVAAANELPAAMIGNQGFMTLQDAVDASQEMTGDVTITLLADSDYAFIVQKKGLNLTIDGCNRTVNGQFLVVCRGPYAADRTETLTIKDVNFTGKNLLTGDAFVYLPAKGSDYVINGKTYKFIENNEAHDITIVGCTFTGEEGARDVVVFKAPKGSQSVYGLTISNVTARNVHSLAQLTSCTGDFKFTGCTVTDAKNGVNLNNAHGEAFFENNTFSVSSDTGTYGVCICKETEVVVTMGKGNVISANGALVICKDAGKAETGNHGKFIVEDGDYTGQVAIIATAAPDAAIIISGGTFDHAIPFEYCKDGCVPTIEAVEGRWGVVKAFAGDGTETSPFLINNLDDLKKFRDLVNAGQTMKGLFYRLTADIDLSSEEDWKPIAAFNFSDADSKFFAGVFSGEKPDGSVPVIDNLKITVCDTDLPAFFGSVNGATIRNLKFDHVNVQCTGIVGGVAAYAAGNVTFEGVTIGSAKTTSVIRNVANDNCSGLLAFTCSPVQVHSCTNYASVTGYLVAGLVGTTAGTANNWSHVIDCANYGTVESTAQYVGAGILGRINDGYAEVRGCVNYGKVFSQVASDFVGGICGVVNRNGETTTADDVIISHCVNHGEISSPVEPWGRAGGIVGNAGNSFTYSFCANLGEVTGAQVASGIAVQIDAFAGSPAIRHCYNGGKVTTTIADGGAYGVMGPLCGPVENVVVDADVVATAGGSAYKTMKTVTGSTDLYVYDGDAVKSAVDGSTYSGTPEQLAAALNEGLGETFWGVNEWRENHVMPLMAVVVPKMVARIGEKEYPSFQKAFAALKSGETVTVLAGEHTNDSTIVIGKSDVAIVGEAGATIVCAAEKTDMFQIIGGTFSNITFSNLTMKVSNAAAIQFKDLQKKTEPWDLISNLRVEDCTFENTGAVSGDCAALKILARCENLVFVRNTVKGFFDALQFSWNENWYEFHSGCTGYNLIADNVFDGNSHNALILASTICKTKDGTEIEPLGPQRKFIVANNTIKNGTNRAIKYYQVENAEIILQGNEITEAYDEENQFFQVTNDSNIPPFNKVKLTVWEGNTCDGKAFVDQNGVAKGTVWLDGDSDSKIVGTLGETAEIGVNLKSIVARKQVAVEANAGEFYAGYASLGEAVADAQAGETVKLTAATTETVLLALGVIVDVRGMITEEAALAQIKAGDGLRIKHEAGSDIYECELNYFAKVDGKDYLTPEEAFAAVQAGGTAENPSVVEIYPSKSGEKWALKNYTGSGDVGSLVGLTGKGVVVLQGAEDDAGNLLSVVNMGTGMFAGNAGPDNFTGLEIVFENLHLYYNHQGAGMPYTQVLRNPTSETYRNCVIDGQYCTQSPTLLDNCTFTGPTHEKDEYLVWNYACTTTIRGCTFLASGSHAPIKQYGEKIDGKPIVCNTIITNCTFAAVGDEKGLITSSNSLNEPSSGILYGITFDTDIEIPEGGQIVSYNCGEWAASYMSVLNGERNADGKFMSGQLTWESGCTDPAATAKASMPGLAFAYEVVAYDDATLPGGQRFMIEPSFAKGAGTEESPFEIWTLADLQKLRDLVNVGQTMKGTYFRQMDDISLATVLNWEPIGNKEAGKDFCGTYDGNGKTVSRLTITGDDFGAGYVALFSSISQPAVIRGLTVKGTVYGNKNAAGVVGCIREGATLIGVTNEVDVTSTSKAGGVCCCAYGHGDEVKCVFTSCVNRGDVKTVNASKKNRSEGGIVAYSTYGDEVGGYHCGMIFENCENYGDMTFEGDDSHRFGGIIGWWENNWDTLTFLNCRNEGDVVADVTQGDVGGMVGNVGRSGNCVAKVSFENCVNLGEIKGQDRGGMIGEFTNPVSQATVTGSIALTGTATVLNGQVFCGTTIYEGKCEGKIYAPAKVAGAETTVYYPTVQAAINAATSGQVVTMVVATSEAATLKLGVKVGPKARLTTTPAAPEGYAPVTLGDYWCVGFPEGPIEIASMEELRVLRDLSAAGESFEGRSVVLANDITFAGTWDSGIGSATPFKGTFDGKGYAISGLTIVSDDDAVGLFAKLDGATVKNLVLANASVSGTGDVGLIAGQIKDSVLTDNVSSGCTVSGGFALIGGFASGAFDPDAVVSNRIARNVWTPYIDEDADKDYFDLVEPVQGSERFVRVKNFRAVCMIEGSDKRYESFDEAIADAKGNLAKIIVLDETRIPSRFAKVEREDGKIGIDVNTGIFEGEGTATAPWLIPDVATLKIFRDFVNYGYSFKDKVVKVTAEKLDLADEAWVSIGKKNPAPKAKLMLAAPKAEWKAEPAFEGTFNGNGAVVENISGQPLFGYAKDATVTDITVQGTVEGEETPSIIANLEGGTIGNLVSEVVDANGKGAPIAKVLSVAQTTGTLTVLEERPVLSGDEQVVEATKANLVSIRNAVGEDVYYHSLQAAVEAAEPGDEIILLGDTDESVTTKPGVTINLNNHTTGAIKPPPGYSIVVDPDTGKITVKSGMAVELLDPNGNSLGKYAKIYPALHALNIANGCTIKLLRDVEGEGFEFPYDDRLLELKLDLNGYTLTGGDVMYNARTGVEKLGEGTIWLGSADSYESHLTITDSSRDGTGKIMSATNGVSIYLQWPYATLDIEGGEFFSCTEEGKENGVITADPDQVAAYSDIYANINISGGTFHGKVIDLPTTYSWYAGDQVVVQGDPDFTDAELIPFGPRYPFYFDDQVVLMGGMFKKDVHDLLWDHVAADYRVDFDKPGYNEELFSDVSYCYVRAYDYVAKIGDAKYEYLSDAMLAAANNGEIALLADVSIDDCVDNYFGPKDCDGKLNGKTVTITAENAATKLDLGAVAKAANDAVVTFKGLTVVNGAGLTGLKKATYEGCAISGDLVANASETTIFKNCTIDGQIQVAAGDVTFEGCAFLGAEPVVNCICTTGLAKVRIDSGCTAKGVAVTKGCYQISGDTDKNWVAVAKLADIKEDANGRIIGGKYVWVTAPWVAATHQFDTELMVVRETKVFGFAEFKAAAEASGVFNGREYGYRYTYPEYEIDVQNKRYDNEYTADGDIVLAWRSDATEKTTWEVGGASLTVSNIVFSYTQKVGAEYVDDLAFANTGVTTVRNVGFENIDLVAKAPNAYVCDSEFANAGLILDGAKTDVDITGTAFAGTSPAVEFENVGDAADVLLYSNVGATVTDGAAVKAMLDEPNLGNANVTYVLNVQVNHDTGVATYTTAVACIGEMGYASLAAALAAAEDGDTVTVLQTVANEGDLEITKNVTLDGNGQKVTGGTTLLVNSSDVAITGFQFEVVTPAIVSAPAAGWMLDVVNNTFTNSTAYLTVAAADPGAAYGLRVTQNSFGPGADYPFTVKGFANADIVTLDHNYLGEAADKAKIVITDADGVNRSEKIVPTYADWERTTLEGDPVAVIKTGASTLFFTTLGDAIGYAATRGLPTTVEFICDVTDGTGVAVAEGAFPAAKALTVDFAGFTYTAKSGPVGSAGTKNQVFQLLKGNVITMKNGTVEVAADAEAEFRFLIQNYSALTLVDMKLDGTNLKCTVEGKETCYALSNNEDETKITGNTTITAPANGYAFDAYQGSALPGYAGPKVTLDLSEGGKVVGNIELGGGAFAYKAGTIDGDVIVVTTKDEDISGFEAKVIAKDATIGKAYVKLTDAIAAATATDTVALIKDVGYGLTGENAVAKKFALDLHGHALNGAVTVAANGDLTVCDSDQEKVGSVKSGITAEAGKVTVASGTVYGAGAPALLVKNGAEAVVNGGVFVAQGQEAISAETLKYFVSGGYFSNQIAETLCEQGKCVLLDPETAMWTVKALDIAVAVSKVQQRYPWTADVDVDYTLDRFVPDYGKVYAVFAKADNASVAWTNELTGAWLAEGAHRYTWTAGDVEAALGSYTGKVVATVIAYSDAHTFGNAHLASQNPAIGTFPDEETGWVYASAAEMGKIAYSNRAWTNAPAAKAVVTATDADGKKTTLGEFAGEGAFKCGTMGQGAYTFTHKAGEQVLTAKVTFTEDTTVVLTSDAKDTPMHTRTEDADNKRIIMSVEELLPITYGTNFFATAVSPDAEGTLKVYELNTFDQSFDSADFTMDLATLKGDGTYTWKTGMSAYYGLSYTVGAQTLEARFKMGENGEGISTLSQDGGAEWLKSVQITAIVADDTEHCCYLTFKPGMLYGNKDNCDLIEWARLTKAFEASATDGTAKLWTYASDDVKDLGKDGCATERAYFVGVEGDSVTVKVPMQKVEETETYKPYHFYRLYIKD